MKVLIETEESINNKITKQSHQIISDTPHSQEDDYQVLPHRQTQSQMSMMKNKMVSPKFGDNIYGVFLESCWHIGYIIT